MSTARRLEPQSIPMKSGRQERHVSLKLSEANMAAWPTGTSTMPMSMPYS